MRNSAPGKSVRPEWVHRNGCFPRPDPVLITGGAGFVGCNLAHRLCCAGEEVIVFDNLSRPGVERNLAWLRATHGERVQVRVEDMRDPAAIQAAARAASAVFHLAGQVAVTSSLVSPLHDFEVNARGTLNLLEALRSLEQSPPLFFTSTNKVYGHLGSIDLELQGNRYQPCDAKTEAHGVAEDQALDFYSPYGCSKGTADQYVLDYARTFGIPAVVFRMSCIYGPHQFGTEDQGWVAHFLIQAMNGRPITIYGDGCQVRDVLFVEDLIDAFFLARAGMPTLSGNVFNLGGGQPNSISLLELIDLISELEGKPARVKMSEWRPGDQRYYVTDFTRFQNATGWRPRIGVREGVRHLHEWLRHSPAEDVQAELATA